MDDDLKVNISVIIPTRNEQDYIEECIDSLLNCRSVEASGFNVEFIIVDGMSTDRTVGIVKEKFSHLNLKILNMIQVHIGSMTSLIMQQKRYKSL